jgi:hypothetical protein
LSFLDGLGKASDTAFDEDVINYKAVFEGDHAASMLVPSAPCVSATCEAGTTSMEPIASVIPLSRTAKMSHALSMCADSSVLPHQAFAQQGTWTCSDVMDCPGLDEQARDWSSALQSNGTLCPPKEAPILRGFPLSGQGEQFLRSMPAQVHPKCWNQIFCSQSGR